MTTTTATITTAGSPLIWKQDAAHQIAMILIKKESNPDMTVDMLVAFIRNDVDAKIKNLYLNSSVYEWIINRYSHDLDFLWRLYQANTLTTCRQMITDIGLEDYLARQQLNSEITDQVMDDDNEDLSCSRVTDKPWFNIGINNPSLYQPLLNSESLSFS
jgi:hypothetical protein